MIFRYPGGKNRLAETICEKLDPMLRRDDRFYDVFTGGGSIALYIAEKYPNAKITMNDLDRNIFAFWSIVAEHDDRIYDLFKLMRRKPTVGLFTKMRKKDPIGMIEQAYYAIFFNRCTFSGIYTSGPIGGYEQKSDWKIYCRYNYKTLKRDMLHARELLAGRTTVTNLHFVDVLRNKGVFYLDPPYYTMGDTLYPTKMTHEEHINLADILRDRKSVV
jgi:DNA adenine methylase